MLQLDVMVDPCWPGSADWAGLVEAAVAAALRASDHDHLNDPKVAADMSIRLADDATVHALNMAWRGKDKPTNVLSFPMSTPEAIAAGGRASARPGTDEPPLPLGDIICAFGVCATEADARGISLPVHVQHLAIHGTLHLLGYDHEEDDAAECMEAIEIAALAALGHPNPYDTDPALGQVA